MNPRRRVSFFLDADLESGLKALKARIGIPQAEAIRRAIAEYLERQDEGPKTKRKRAGSRRKRP